MLRDEVQIKQGITQDMVDAKENWDKIVQKIDEVR